MLNILLVEDEPELRELLAEQLAEAGHHVQTAQDGAEGTYHLHRRVYDLMISDVWLPSVDGLTLFRRAQQERPATEVILMTAHADVAQAVAALKEGAYDYLTKPFDVEELLHQVRRIDETCTLRREIDKARGELSGRVVEAKLVGASPSIHRVIEMTRRVAHSDAPVLIVGESGTGKEIVARMIHEKSPRRDRPFVAVNCGALAERLIESELFGHEAGAFTGAVGKRDGRFKAADGGVLFLDEIAELPAAAQAKLLRVLQEGAFEPVGTNRPVQVDVRIVSATHRDLPERIKAGLFREDLFYRVNVIEIRLPSLRDRAVDVPLLVRHFLQRSVPPGAAVPRVSPAAWASLVRYDYPGNVRELAHAMEHAVVLSGGQEIDLPHLPPAIAGAKTPVAFDSGAMSSAIRPLRVALREFERQYLQQALRASKGSRSQMAAMLGMSRKTLWEKLRRDHVEPEGEEVPSQ